MPRALLKSFTLLASVIASSQSKVHVIKRHCWSCFDIQWTEWLEEEVACKRFRLFAKCKPWHLLSAMLAPNTELSVSKNSRQASSVHIANQMMKCSQHLNAVSRFFRKYKQLLELKLLLKCATLLQCIVKTSMQEYWFRWADHPCLPPWHVPAKNPGC